ncbi:Large extracellular alpha-helical protein [Elusimicrobium minutum Pei191]|uniref:Large extracellular alpha-helical protein n=1 Tax=Elusimicrobium minutum (strain Pei191) TaxID=445932 RepID=B2KD57_ELUMP|nr:MG2 domain-containing protein [Elusimicrobium minutum]ACC98453.1 Large extracellular alpha-helical protein [Elusimicrobium minutum Pei191]
MKKLAALVSILMLTAFSATAQTLASANKKFENGQFQAALTEYEQLINNSDKNTAYTAQLKSVASLLGLFQYENAAKKAYSFSLPEDNIWKARFLLFRAFTGTQVINNYGFAMDTDEIQTETEDLGKFTRDQWLNKIGQDYDLLWSIAPKLINAAIEDESDFINTKDTDTKRIPTLLDFAVTRIEGFVSLLDSGYYPLAKAELKAKNFIVQNYSGRNVTEWNIERLASVYEEASKLEGNLRNDARGFWKVQRIMIPFDRDRSFDFNDKDATAEEAAKILSVWAGFTKEEEVKTSFFQRLFGSQKSNSKFTPYAQAFAAHNSANLFNRINQYEQAHATASYCGNLQGGGSFADLCKQLVKNIEEPVLEVTHSPIAPDPQNIQYKLDLRNVNTVYARIYKTTEEELKSFIKKDSYYYPNQSYDHLRNLKKHAFEKDVLKKIMSKKPVREFQQNVKYDKKYSFLRDEVFNAPQIDEKGLYITLISRDKNFNTTTAPVLAAILNITDIMMAATSAVEGNPNNFLFDLTGKAKSPEANIFKVYTLNPVTGEPLDNVTVKAFLDHNNRVSNLSALTNAEGVTNFKGVISLSNFYSNNFRLDPIARKGNSVAYLNSMPNLSYNPPEPFEIFVETDRGIYRPGQNVEVKVTVLERVPRGFKTYSRQTKPTIELRNANYKQISKATLTLNDFGSASYKFTLPKEGLLGSYSIIVDLKDPARNTSGSASFSVEEYKRPEFEVTIAEPSAPWLYGEKAVVNGTAKYYFGGGAADAAVEYTVYRQDYVPYFFWWFRWYQPSAKEEVAHGLVKADKQGNFNFDFIPQPRDAKDEKSKSSRFTVEVAVRDEGGRTISASRSFLAAKERNFFKIDLPTGFANENTPYKVDVSMVDINGNPLEGSAEFEVYGLENKFEENSVSSGRRNNSPSLEEAYKNAKETAKVFSVALSFNKEKPTTATIPGMKEGVYKIRLKDKNGTAEQSVILLVVSANPKLDLPLITIAEHSKYYPGETARILFGSGKIKKAKYVEFYKDSFLLAQDTVKEGGASIYKVNIINNHRGGIAMRWFAVSDYLTFTDEINLLIPNNDKELTLKINPPKSVLPGQKVTWSIDVADYQKKPVNAEATVKVYDRSLDYYQTNNEQLTHANLYPASSDSGYYYRRDISNSQFNTYFVNFYTPEFLDRRYISIMPLPHFFAEYSYRNYSSRSLGGLEMRKSFAKANIAEESAAGEYIDAVMETSAVYDSDQMNAAAPTQAPVTTGAAVEMDKEAGRVEARTDMSETAYFGPHTKITNGKGKVSFTMPQRLTSWNIAVNAITKDALLGTVTAQTVTRKDLMIRLETPRFFRERDKGQIKGIITNDTNKDLIVNTVLLVKEDGQNAYSALNLADTRQTVTVKANSQASVIWEAAVADGARVLTLTATARAGQVSDGEVKELPILPSRERLVDSKVTALKEGSNTITLDTLKKDDPTREYDLIALQIDPNLLLPVMNSLPMLVQYPFESLSSLTAKYVPLAIINNLYQKYPELKKAVAALPKRDSITPPWENDNPSRQMVLAETPWIFEAEGKKITFGQIIDMFDSKLVAKYEGQMVEKISKYQNKDGGFSWFQGGESNIFMTLYVLDGLAEAANQDVKVPEQMTKNAMRFVTQTIDDYIKNVKDTGASQIVASLYASYVLTSFPKEWKESKTAFEKAKGWIEYASKYPQFMTPLGKIYAANVYHRLGDKANSDKYLDMVLDAVKVDDTVGAYFQPEDKSWLWYHDTLETHAITLRTLLKLRPENEKLADDMTKWLLFNRKGNNWDSTKSTASAIYCLVDVMKARGAFESKTAYEVKWGNIKETKSFEPFDFVSKPLRYTVFGSDANSTFLEASVNKKGKTVDFASLTAVYSTNAKVEESPKGLLNISRQYFLREKEGAVYKLKPIADGGAVNVGDEIEVQLTITTSSQFEFVHIKDPRGAGFEAETLLSGWQWDLLRRYEEPRDSLTNFFVDWLPHGIYTLKYRMRPTTPGVYKVGAAQMQSSFAPEFAAHSANMTITVK